MSNVKIFLLVIVLIAIIIAVEAQAIEKVKVCYENGKCEKYCKQGKQLTKVGEWISHRGSCMGSQFNEDCSMWGTDCGGLRAHGYRFEHDYTLDYPQCCHKIKIKI